MFFQVLRLFFFSLAALILGGHIYYVLTGDFKPANILAVHPSLPFVQTQDEDNQQVKKILNQHFYFLGHGHQTYVFVSKDQKYVLKFFMRDYLQRAWYFNILPPISPFRPYLVYSGESKQYRTDRLLNGYAIAYHLDRENSGLFFLHYGDGSAQGFKVLLVNKFGMQQQLNLDDFIFVVQEKVTTTRAELSQLLKTHQIERAKERIRQLFALYMAEYRLALWDQDHNIIDNTGFVGEKAIRHDVGKLIKDDNILSPAEYIKDLKKIAWERIDPWIGSHFPEYRQEIAQELELQFPHEFPPSGPRDLTTHDGHDLRDGQDNDPTTKPRNVKSLEKITNS